MKTFHKSEIVFEGFPFSLETGKYAKQADGAVWCKYGNTVLLATVVASKEELKEERDFFPLTVDYLEKFYAAGRFPGGFLKRESQPTTDEKLTSRIIDRPIRPLFPDWFRNETQVIVTLLSHDENCDARVISVTAASAALMVSDIPFLGPIAAVRVMKKDGQFYINPNAKDQENSHLNIVMAANRESIVMVEGSGNEATEEEMTEALDRGHAAIQALLTVQEALAEKVAPVKRSPIVIPEDAALANFIELFIADKIGDALKIREKLVRYKAIDDVKKSVEEIVAQKLADGAPFLDADNPDKVIRRSHQIFEKILKRSLRSMITVDNIRIDGRNTREIRPIWIELGVLPYVHGSAIFTRGETQSLGTITLGVGSDEQRVDTVAEECSKNFMLHYNFPPFSVGEVKRLASPGRREIGHGNLAERALTPLIPKKEDFGYTIRVVSEILESNGSSSMASVCSGCLSLMDAGVPFKKHVAGIAMGLIKENNEYAILSDIMGDEDHLGDMDFKVAGTVDGITAIQMDIKIDGLPKEVMKKALTQAREGRLHIIGKMKEAISEPRAELSPYAPKIVKIQIDPERIRDLIGTGGKNIKSIIDQTGAEIEVEQNGTVSISAKDSDVLNRTLAMVKSFTDMVEKGKIYEGVVTRVEEYGAFVEVMPNQIGLMHVSKIDDKRVEKVTDYVNVGDKVRVIVTEIEGAGKFKLSMRPTDLDPSIPRPEGSEQEGERRPPRRDRDDHHRRDHRDGDRHPRGDRGHDRERKPYKPRED